MEDIFEEKLDYADLENRLYSYTDGWKLESGAFPLKMKSERENADAILKQHYNNVDEHHLDYDDQQEDGTNYKIIFSEPKEVEEDVDKDKVKLIQGDVKAGIDHFNAMASPTSSGPMAAAESLEEGVNDSPVFATLVNDYTTTEALVDDYKKFTNNMQLFCKRFVSESVEIHKELNKKLFNGYELKQEVRDKILEIVNNFKQTLKEQEDLDLDVLDVLIAGSSAAFNYTEESDIDVDIVADLEKYGDAEDIAQKLYWALKTLWNNKYEPLIYGHEVELYVDANECKAKSNGIYSLYNGWVKKPTQEDIPDIDEKELNSAVKPFVDRLNNAKDIDELNSLEDDLYRARFEGIFNHGGEYSKGNLVYKEFRKKGYLDKLEDKKTELENKEMSLENLDEGALDKVKAGIKKVADAAFDTEEISAFDLSEDEPKLQQVAAECDNYDDAMDACIAYLFDHDKDVNDLLTRTSGKVEVSKEDEQLIQSLVDQIYDIAHKVIDKKDVKKFVNKAKAFPGKAINKVKADVKDMIEHPYEEDESLTEADKNGNETTIEEVKDRVEKIISDLVSDKYFKVEKSEHGADGNEYKYTFIPTQAVKNLCMDQGVWDLFNDDHQNVVINQFDDDGDNIIEVAVDFVDDAISRYFNYTDSDNEKQYENIKDTLESMITADAIEYNVKEANKEAGFTDESLEEATKVTEVEPYTYTIGNNDEEDRAKMLELQDVLDSLDDDEFEFINDNVVDALKDNVKAEEIYDILKDHYSKEDVMNWVIKAIANDWIDDIL